MATERSPYVCIGDSLLDEPWPYEVKAALVMLSCHMHARWRSDRRLTLGDVAHSHPISMSDLQKITGKGRRDVALTSLQRLADFASISIELRGDVVWIEWPKWAEYNGTHSRSPISSGAPPRPRPATIVPRPAREEESAAFAAPSSPSERLANALGKEPGERAAKVAFCEKNLSLWEAEAAAEGITKRTAVNAKVVTLAIRWWRQEQRNPSGARASPGEQSEAEIMAYVARVTPSHRRIS